MSKAIGSPLDWLRARANGRGGRGLATSPVIKVIEKNPQSSFEVRRCGRCRGRHLRRAQFFFYALPRNFTCQVSPAFIFYHFIKQRTCVGWLSCTLLHKIASSRFAAGTEESCYGDERHFLKIKRNVFVPCSRILSAFAERRPPPPSAAAARAAC